MEAMEETNDKIQDGKRLTTLIFLNGSQINAYLCSIPENRKIFKVE